MFSGGYSTSNAFYSHYCYGHVDQTQLDAEEVPCDITSATATDFNALYGSCLTTKLPLSDFRLLKQEQQSSEFRKIEENLRGLNLEFFQKLCQEHSTGFLFRIVLDYDRVESLQTSVDFSMFPRFRSVKLSELSSDQQNEARKMNRKVDKEPPKLVSTMEKQEVVDYLENVLFLIIHMSCRIVEIKEIVIYKHCDIFKDYIGYLQKQRAMATSSVEAKLIKALG